MRKRVITPNASASSQAWLDVESAAVVEVTSEGGAYPIDSALAITRETWLVSGEAGQTIRLISKRKGFVPHAN